MLNNLCKLILSILFLFSIPQICYSKDDYHGLLEKINNEQLLLDKIGEELFKIVDSEEFNSEIEFHQLVEAYESIKNVSTIIGYEIQFMRIKELVEEKYIEEFYKLRIYSIQISKSFLINKRLILSKDYESIKNKTALRIIDKAISVAGSLLEHLQNIEKIYYSKLDTVPEQKIKTDI